MNQFSELFMNEIYLEEKLPTKNNILLQAFKLYLANNVDRVTVEDLEKNTGASRGAIFYHFQNNDYWDLHRRSKWQYHILDRFYQNRQLYQRNHELYPEKQAYRLLI